tara:strand:- start:303 stop:1079 length:777 start_codon:yes stop_codon:yes gene_type:complete
MKNVLITAGSRGIGFSIAKEFAKENFNLILISKNLNSLKRARKELIRINSKIQCQIFTCDLTNINKAKKVFIKIKKKNSIDIIINNFGGSYKIKLNSILNTKNLINLIESNIICSYTAIETFVDQMIKSKWGRVINISSAINQTFDTQINYHLVKSAQVLMIKNLSTKIEYLKNNITFNSISPGAILSETSIWNKLMKKNKIFYKKIIKKNFPMGLGKTSDVSNLVLFLCSNKGNYINGTNIVLDGGRSNFKNIGYNL